MSGVAHAVKKTLLRIPRPLLQEAFLKPLGPYYQQHVSLEQQLISKVLYGRVMLDMNVVGGSEVFVPLWDIPRETIEQFTTVFRVPKSATDGRSIVSVLSVNFLDPNALNTFGSTTSCGRGELLQASKALMDSNANIPPISSAYIELVAENTVVVRYTHILPPNTFLRCRLAYDDELSSIPPRAWNTIAEAMVLATKAYIYMNQTIELDQGMISGGSELGRFAQLVDRYESADEEYELFVKEQLQGVLNMIDQEGSRRHYRMAFGGYR